MIENGTAGPAIGASKVHQIKDTLDAVRMELSDEDSYLHLDRDLPEVAAAGLPALVDEFLESAALTRGDIDHWIVHPGGRRILDCIREPLSLTASSSSQLRRACDPRQCRHALDLLRPAETTERRRPGPGERGLMITVGPGVTSG